MAAYEWKGHFFSIFFLTTQHKMAHVTNLDVKNTLANVQENGYKLCTYWYRTRTEAGTDYLTNVPHFMSGGTALDYNPTGSTFTRL